MTCASLSGTYKGSVSDEACTSCNIFETTEYTGSTDAFECFCMDTFIFGTGSICTCPAGYAFNGMNGQCEQCQGTSCLSNFDHFFRGYLQGK